MLTFYIIFSYLFMFGAMTANDRMPVWNFTLAPLVLPMALGRGLSLFIDKILDR